MGDRRACKLSMSTTRVVPDHPALAIKTGAQLSNSPSSINYVTIKSRKSAVRCFMSVMERRDKFNFPARSGAGDSRAADLRDDGPRITCALRN